ncbi:Tify domain binding domain [Dillenia turbinata]|uniref:Ninja-family protein n=1 Tax=Dillenia turbinata TaxID=194707 RepID=A0AAN8V7S7_9MAGN
MNRVRIPRGMPRLHIVLPRNRRLSFGTSESLVKRARDAEVNQFGANVVQMIPRAITIGNGPLGRRIEGFLYKFSGEEELKIVCVCHGMLFSPAGFFKHAGGTDVPNSSRYITVVGVPLSFITGPNGYSNPNPNGNGNVNEDENNNEDVNEVPLDSDGDGN